MSFDAQSWALKQRGLKPVLRVVLWHLSDRHNDDLGYCFVHQVKLADECEVSRASLNRHLDELETRGLIRRENRRDATSGKQLATYYRLAYDQFGVNAEPQDVVVRVAKLDTANRVSKTRKSVSQSSETPITNNRTNKLPLTPRGAEGPSPQDVDDLVRVNAALQPDLYRECCAIDGHKPGLTDKVGGWTFAASVVDQAQRRLDDDLTHRSDKP